MATSDQIVPIPIGAGVDREPGEFVLRPPSVREAKNVHLLETGALTKRPGWETLPSGAVSLGANTDILFPQGDTLAVFSDNRNIIYRDGDTSQLGRYQPTFDINSHPAFAAIGTIHNVNVAHLNGYTAVVASVHNDPTEMANNVFQSGTAVYAILDADWNVVVGPVTNDNIAILPRVEPVTVSGLTYFMFIGLSDPSNSASAYWLNAASLNLNAIRVSTGGTTVSFLGLDTVIPYNNATDFSICYDSYSSAVDGDLVFLSYYSGSEPVNLHWSTLNPNGGSFNAVNISGTGTSPASMAVWYDNPTNTALLFSEETGLLYYDTEALAAISNISHPGSPPDSTRAVDVRFPVFWLSGDGGLHLTDREVTLTGGDPALPNYEAQRVVGALHARPQPRGSVKEGFFFSDFTSFSVAAGAFATGGKALEATQVNDVNGSSYAAVVAPLHGTRRTTEYKMGFFDGTGTFLGVLPQTARTSDGRILRADVIATSGFLPRAKERTNTVAAAHELENGLGVLSDSLAIVVTEIDPSSREYSFQEHFSTVILANGGLSTFDGNQVCPVAIRAIASGSAVSTNWPVTPLAGGITWSVANNDSYSLKLTLSYIDRNNVRHRWVIGNTTVNVTTNTTGSPVVIGGVYAIDLPTELLHLARMGLLTMEYWGGHSTSTLGAEQPVAVGRAPLVWDGSQWIGDAGALIDPADVSNPTTYPYLTEAIPAQVPATNIVRKAGDYVFCVASEIPEELWVSKPIGPYTAPEFPAEFMITSPSVAGKIKSLAAIDDHLILLCENGVYELFVGGGGPTALGTGGFPAMSLIYDGSGAISHNGTVSGEWGVIYMAADGPKLLSGNQIQDIGKAIRDQIVPENVIAAVYNDLDREVWLYFEGGDTFIYDLDLGAWTSASFRARAAVMARGRHIRMDTGGRLCTETALRTQDADASYFTAKIVSPWLQVQNPMALKRVKRLAALFKRFSGTTGKITIKVAYNYVDTDIDTFEFTPGTSLDLGDQFVVRLTRQKCNSFRITIEDGLETVDTGEGPEDVTTLVWSLSALSMRAAAKSGHIKLQQEAKL